MNKELSKHSQKRYKKAESEIEEYYKSKKTERRKDDRKYIKCVICGQPKQEKYCMKGGDRNICYECKRSYDASNVRKKREIEELNDIEKLNKNYNKMLRGCGNGQ